MRPPEPFTARPVVPGDATPVAVLVNDAERAYLDEPDSSDAAEVCGWWARLDLSRDSIVVFDPGGTLTAYATLHERIPEAVDLDAHVHPEHTGRGLGGFLLDWVEEESRRRSRPVVRTAALAADRAAVRLAAARGYAPVRHFYRMLVELNASPPEPVWPAGFTVSTFARGDEEVLHDVLEEAFADHWGNQPRDLDTWRTTVFGREWWDPSLAYVVREGEEAVAASINAVRFGMGWIESLGTRKPWRGRGLERALLLLAFGALYRRGERRIGLGVDAGNETGATQLYESVGMRVAWQADVYEKQTGSR